MKKKPFTPPKKIGKKKCLLLWNYQKYGYDNNPSYLSAKMASKFTKKMLPVSDVGEFNVAVDNLNSRKKKN